MPHKEKLRDDYKTICFATYVPPHAYHLHDPIRAPCLDPPHLLRLYRSRLFRHRHGLAGGGREVFLCVAVR